MGWFGVGGARGLGVMFLGLAAAAAWAQEAESGPGSEVAMASAMPAAASPPAPVPPPEVAPWRRPDPGFVAGTWATSPPAAKTPGFSVVEVEPEQLPGAAPGRPRHALKMRTEWPRAALRSMGFAAAECTTLFRMPSSLGRGGGFSVEFRAQMRLTCRY